MHTFLFLFINIILYKTQSHNLLLSDIALSRCFIEIFAETIILN
jgi:hypothetical protein